MDGILNIDKPAGMTSFDVVARVRRLSGERRVGHAGTLDPIATGVLPVFLGRGTRLVEFLQESGKTYRAAIRLGIATDTYDVTGEVLSLGDASAVTGDRLEQALGAFRGEITQTLPVYSAVKRQGKPLYKLARAGIEVAPPQRTTTVYRLDLVDFTPPVVVIEVDCSKGTYIRSIAHELGQALGCGATMQSLARLAYGPFSLADAVAMPFLEETVRHGYWGRYVDAIDRVLYGWQALLVDAATEQAFISGKLLSSGNLPAPGEGARCRVYTASGNFLGLASYDLVSAGWHPEKVFPMGADGC